MSDLINRQEAIDELIKRLFETAYNNIGVKVSVDSIFVDIANRIKTWLNEVPSAERRGQWLKWTKCTIAPEYQAVSYVSTCSDCGAEHFPTCDYCPSCGSRNEVSL